MILPIEGEPRTGLSMGEHAEIMAREWAIPREAQDELALKSHQNLAHAYEQGFFTDLMTPFKGVTKDNNLRALRSDRAVKLRLRRRRAETLRRVLRGDRHTTRAPRRVPAQPHV